MKHQEVNNQWTIVNMLFVMLLIVMCSLSSAESLGLYLEPVKQRDIKTPKDLERSYQCYRYVLESEMTVVDLNTGGEITNQKLSVVIKDQNWNTLRQKEVSIKDLNAIGTAPLTCGASGH